MEFSRIEARIVSVRDVSLVRETLPGEYDLDHYFELFGDVYDWAGQLRTVEIAKDPVPS